MRDTDPVHVVVHQLRAVIRAYGLFLGYCASGLGVVGRGLAFMVISAFLVMFTLGAPMTFIGCLVAGAPIRGLLVGGEQLLLAALCLPALRALAGQRISSATAAAIQSRRGSGKPTL